MSLGAPDLYIAGRKMQARKSDPRPALAGLKLTWGNDSRLDFDPPATLSGQILITDAMPDYLHVGVPVGLVDPVSSRCLFAGTLEPLTASAEPAVAGAMRVSFTAAAPRAELERHTAVDIDWPQDETADARRAKLAATLPRGWTLEGARGWSYVLQGQQRHQNIDWLALAERYVRGYLQRFHDTSTYTPGGGLRKRLTITDERPPFAGLPWADTTDGGAWVPGNPTAASGTAVLPKAAINRDIEWEKTPADVVTAVQVTTWGMWLVGPKAEEDSYEHEWPLDWVKDTADRQAAYGTRLARIETSLSAQSVAATRSAVDQIVTHWLDTQTDWRPTNLQLVDSRRLATAPLLNLLAVDTRHMAAVHVPDAAGPAPIRSFVLGGSATWTGKKWITDLTLGRRQ